MSVRLLGCRAHVISSPSSICRKSRLSSIICYFSEKLDPKHSCKQAALIFWWAKMRRWQAEQKHSKCITTWCDPDTMAYQLIACSSNATDTAAPQRDTKQTIGVIVLSHPLKWYQLIVSLGISSVCVCVCIADIGRVWCACVYRIGTAGCCPLSRSAMPHILKW